MSVCTFPGWLEACSVHSQSRLPLLKALRDGQAVARVSRIVVNDRDITRVLQDMVLPIQFWQLFAEDPEREIDWRRGYCSIRPNATLGFPSKQHWVVEGLEFRAEGGKPLSALGYSRRSYPVVELDVLASWLENKKTEQAALTEEQCKALSKQDFPGQRISRHQLRSAMKKAGVAMPRGRPKNRRHQS